MVLSGTGSAILTWMVIEKLVFHASLAQRIWPLIGIFFVLIGVQLFISGLLADIAVRNYYQARNRMNYTIREIINQ